MYNIDLRDDRNLLIIQHLAAIRRRCIEFIAV